MKFVWIRKDKDKNIGATIHRRLDIDSHVFREGNRGLADKGRENKL
jgi:hypothetical protein